MRRYLTIEREPRDFADQLVLHECANDQALIDSRLIALRGAQAWRETHRHPCSGAVYKLSVSATAKRRGDAIPRSPASHRGDRDHTLPE